MEKLAAARPRGVILREKDLKEQDYKNLAGRVLEICRRYGTACILHQFAKAAAELGCSGLHLPLPALRELPEREKKQFSMLGASCHSVSDAVEAEKLGCTYITAGHVFETDCKKGLCGRGIAFLQEICGSVSVPVYAIGGITPGRMDSVRKAGAEGACVMSGAMACVDAAEYLREFEEKRPVCKEGK